MALGGAVALVASTLTGFQPVLLVILGIVWWATHKLTFDCTLLDEDQDAGVGLLQESGLDPSALADTGPPPRDRRPGGDGRVALAREFREEEREAGRRRRPPAQCAGRLAGLFHARLAPALWPGTMVRAGRRGRTAQRVVRLLSRLHLQRNGPAAGDELPQSPALPAPAQAQDARGHDGHLAVDGRHRDRGLDGAGGGLAVARHGLERRARFHARNERPPRIALRGAQGWRRQGRRGRGPEERSRRRTANRGQGKRRRQERPGQCQDRRRCAANRRRRRMGPRARKDRPSRISPEIKKARTTAPTTRPIAPRTTTKNDDKRRSERRRNRTTTNRRRENQNPSDAANPPPKLPSVPFQAPSWLHGLFMVVGAVALIFGLFRYGPVLLDALRELIASLLGGFGFRKPKKRAKERGGRSRASRCRRPGRSPRSPIRSPVGWPRISVPMTWSSTVSRRSRPGRSSRISPVRRTRRRANLSHRLGQARADLRQDATRLAGYFVTIVYGQRGFKAEVLPPLRQFWRALGGCRRESCGHAVLRSASARQSPSASTSRSPPRIRE